MSEAPDSQTPDSQAGDTEPAGELPALRRCLLAGMQRHAPFDGWSAAALQAAAREEGVTPEMAAVAFQGGPAEIADFFTREADRQMVEALQKALSEKRPLSEAGVEAAPEEGSRTASSATGAAGAGGLKIRERVALAVRTRLLQHAAHREALRALASFLAMPANAGLAARSLWRTVDAMWHAIGDTSTDFNYYSKRTLLAGIYGSTVLVWLDDHSEGFTDTFAFLDRRIDNAMAIERGKARLRRIANDLFTRTTAVVRPSRDYPKPDMPVRRRDFRLD
jgi:ubiquinone biosynthesis protein COQ9